MKIKRKILFFVALMSLFYCVSFMQDTYAKYISSAAASANLTIARWNILINNQDIVNNSNFSSTITPTFEGTTYIKSGVIAPTATGYFDITINGQNTDVSFTYNISVSESNSNTVSDLVITKYVIDEVEYNYTTAITGNMLFDDTVKTKTIRFYVEWNDDDQTETMDNALDTTAANSGVAALDVIVNVIQMH
jgi:preprotein translocase subunit Sec63